MSFIARSYGPRTLSVYGGAGGRGTRISSSSSGNLYGSAGGGGGGGGGFNLADCLPSANGLDLHVGANEKATLQNLNDRLASYLERVRTLEKENHELECKIRDWLAQRTVVCHDHSGHLVTIEDLQDKIRALTMGNNQIVLAIDNAKLAADDFSVKYENEMAMRLSVEGDITGLRRILDELSLTRSDMEMQYEGLKEELVFLNKNHAEELAVARTQVGGQVNVEVDAAPSTDLNLAMQEIREHYEAVAAKNRRDLEAWYQTKMSTVEQEVVTQNEGLMLYRTELKELKSTFQRLQIELQSHLSMKNSLECTLAETQERYSCQLDSLQATVSGLEAQLSQLHANIDRTRQDYDQLLDIKTRLEREIAEYRRLLDGEESETQIVTKTITVVETIVDGRIVESSKTVDIDVQSDNDDD
ncbi:keratin 98 [Clupea harengus]|uniref:Keratin 98 n=1 Tax=Clupea harengus TaxID=7950 RepID=A0A6P8F1G0_CLUHA|nr:keratin 98 [Clupea harengus]